MGKDKSYISVILAVLCYCPGHSVLSSKKGYMGVWVGGVSGIA